MRAITFESKTVIDRFVPGRMDVACFIGFASKHRQRNIPIDVVDWWRQQGWISADKKYSVEDGYALPVPLESWEDYTTLFAEQRNDRRAQVVGDTALENPLSLADNDRELQVLVDHHLADSPHGSMVISIEPDDGAGSLGFKSLVDQLNGQLKGASASIQNPQGEARLVIERSDDVNPGELTVYANSSLGFTEPQQDDVFSQPSPVSAAIRSFFQQGGRRCYLVPLEAPLPMLASEEDKIRRLLRLVWGPGADNSILGRARFDREDFVDAFLPKIESAVTPDQSSSSLALVLTLSDASYLSLPDLVDLLATYDDEGPREEDIEIDETFTQCSEEDLKLPLYYLQRYSAPVLGESDYRIWHRLIFRVLEFLTQQAPTMQFVSSLPLPDRNIRAPFESYVSDQLLGYVEGNDKYYRRLQLAYPWLKTPNSGGLPQQLLAPEGSLLGLLARNALLQGAYRSIAGSIHDGAYDLYPRDLNPYTTTDDQALPYAQDSDPYAEVYGDAVSFMERVNCFDFVPDGIALISDVTADLSPYNRYAVVRRIMMLVQKAAYQLGLNHVFESSGASLWRTIEASLSSLLMNIYQNNGLRGKTAFDAFSVTCDRSTMTQTDIDNGRLIARIEFRPAVPVEKISIALAIDNNGMIGLGGQS